VVVRRLNPARLARLARGAVEELHDIGDDADSLPSLLLGGLPLAPLQASVDADTTTLSGEPADALSRYPEGAHVEKVGTLARIAVGVPPARVASKAQAADAAARGQRA